MMETHLAGKGKLGHVRGEKQAPLVGAAGYEQWKMHDSMIKGLILNSLDSSLIGNFHEFSLVFYRKGGVGCLGYHLL